MRERAFLYWSKASLFAFNHLGRDIAVKAGGRLKIFIPATRAK